MLVLRVAIIPARGGSKRIPRKNIRLFLGRPIISYSIQAAIASGCFDRVIVSTDDQEIAEIAKKYSAEAPFVRPVELADDISGTNAVIKHAINWLIDAGNEVDYVCCIYATAPFITPHYIQVGLKQLLEKESNFVFPVTSFPFPIQRSVRINADGCIEAVWPENIFLRSQDLEETFHDAGQFYWGKSQSFLDDVPVFSSASRPIILPRYLVQDIDTLEDWRRAELMLFAIQKDLVYKSYENDN